MSRLPLRAPHAPSTLSRPDMVEMLSPTQPYVEVVRYGAGRHTWRVVHDRLVHRPYGLYRVYEGKRQIGAQLSYPSREDCLAMSGRNPKADA